MILIGICGASGSGKSTLAEELQRRIKGKGVLINQDAYYKDHSHMSLEERAKVNYDEPDVFEHDLLLHDVEELLAGRSVTRKGYDYTRHCRADTGEMIEPGDVLIVEGIHAFYDERLLKKMDLRIYMSVDPDICFLRRAQRDISERGRDIDSVARQYLATVRPMYNRYIRGYAEFADLVVPGGGKNKVIADILTEYLDHRI